MVPDDVQAEDPDAFQQGVLAGQQAAINGLDIVASPCVDLNADFLEPVELAAAGFEARVIGREVIKKAFGGAVFSLVLQLVDLAIGLQTHFDDPQEELSARVGQLQDLLNSMGITDSMELFIGGAVDFNAKGCELMLTPVFRSADAAFAAAKNLGRSELLAVSWRTDQSGGMTLVDSVE